jgi:hypothetical protein
VAKDDKPEIAGKNDKHEPTSGHPSHSLTQSHSQQQPTGDAPDHAGTLLTSAALIGVGVLLEPELLGGMLLGAGAVYAARTLPIVGGILRPMMRSAIKYGYAAVSKMNEVVSEATEDVQDMVAEARSDYQGQYHNEHEG